MMKEPHDDLSNVISLQSQSCELIRMISMLVKAIKFFLFYQLVQLSIFVTVGSLTLVTTIKGW